MKNPPSHSPKRRAAPRRRRGCAGQAGPWVLSVVFLGTAHAADEAAPPAAQPEVVFDTTFLRTRADETVDLRRFSRANAVMPGLYTVDVWINGLRRDRQDIRFVAGAGGEGARPCLSRRMLQDWGVDLSRVDVHAVPVVDDGAHEEVCLPLAARVPGATAQFDFGEQSLTLSIPQIYVRRSARGYVSPDRWDYGVNTAFLNYNASVYRSDQDGRSLTQGYLGLDGGANIGGWRLRSQGSLSTSSADGAHYANIATYLQHDVQSLRSQATLGDAYTSGEVFDSVAFRGVQLATDDRMLPDSQRGYAPVVRGTAQTNARVTVRQNGQVIYETQVPPGPFEISDLYATGYGGNLEVTVQESSGRSSSFVVPYAALPQSLRPGITRYVATAGRMRNDNLRETPAFAQFTLQRGLSNSVTGYGGVIAAEGYAALNTGAALNTRYGAFSGDVTVARTDVPGQGQWRGASWRASYSKFFAASATNFALAAYRYSTAGYMGFADAAMVRDAAMHDGDVDAFARQRGRLQLTVNQAMGRWGSVFVSASSQLYWNRPQTDTFFQAGYSNSFGWGSYTLTAGRTRDAAGRMATQVGLGLTIPLGSAAQAPLLTANGNQFDGGSDAQASLSGTLGEQGRFSYNAYGGYHRGDGASGGNGGASGTYRGAYGQLTASASGGSGASQVSAGVSGAVVAHPGGVSLAQTVGDTFAVVHAPGAQGASISSAPGVKVDGDGYAVVPFLTPYAMNTISIDPKGASTDVAFASTSEQAVPRGGAVPLVEFETVTGRAALIEVEREDGRPLPFGADVVDEGGRIVGVAAQGGRIFARGLDERGVLTVRWGEAAGDSCRVAYALPARRDKDVYQRVKATCLPVPDAPPAPGRDGWRIVLQSESEPSK